MMMESVTKPQLASLLEAFLMHKKQPLDPKLRQKINKHFPMIYLVDRHGQTIHTLEYLIHKRAAGINLEISNHATAVSIHPDSIAMFKGTLVLMMHAEE